MPDAYANGIAPALAAEVAAAGGPVARPADHDGSVGRTLFDLPGSADLTVTVLLPNDHLHRAPSQSLVRIRSTDGRRYLGVVTAGPFAEPDGLRGDSPMLQAVATHGGDYLPPYHGRIQVSILGEEIRDGETTSLTPPRLRPLPNSPVWVLDDSESAVVLKCDGDVRLGLAAGHEGVVVGVPSGAKAVFPRHTAILGTTGGGKSNTVAGLVKRATAAGMAVVLLDVEGEYTRLHEANGDGRMSAALAARGLTAEGVPADAMTVYHLVGRDTTNPAHPHRQPFSLQFAYLSPYQVFEILGLSDAQQERFLKAYDIAKEVMRDLGIFPARSSAEQEQMVMELDEFERGYPRMTLGILMDVVQACLKRADSAGERKGRKGADDEDEPSFDVAPWSKELNTPEGKLALRKRVHSANPPGNAISWRSVVGKLARLNRLKVFYTDKPDPPPVTYSHLLKPGSLSVFDLSDSGYSELNNLVIADLLRGIQQAQDAACEEAEKTGDKPPRVLIVIEEAHEFLSDERIDQTPILFQQVARIAKRGRKRWLGLCFVTQLPAHLPKQVLGLCNSFILHKLTDPFVVNLLKRQVGGVDDGLWDRLPGLAPGQAVAAFPHLTRPILVSIDPAPCQLRMTE